MRITKSELKKIRKQLPSGSYEVISSITGFGVATIKSSLFIPERVKAEVITTALEIIEKEKQRIIAIKNTIKEA